MKNTEEKNKNVVAEVTFLSATGQDPLNKVITSENVHELLPDEASIAAVRAYFENRNISFRYDQGISATITAEPDLFEKIFGVGLTLDNNHYTIRDQEEDLMLPLTSLPKDIQKHISNISLPGRMELF